MIDAFEERAILMLAIKNVAQRSGKSGEVMSYIFKEYFNLPVKGV
jgi:hypothetical protein